MAAKDGDVEALAPAALTACFARNAALLQTSGDKVQARPPAAWPPSAREQAAECKVAGYAGGRAVGMQMEQTDC
eukprot:6212624-Pleurochrysis_carterae.AAC.1